MPRKPNYDFERREREKAKAAKVADRTAAKNKKKEESGQANEPSAGTPEPDAK